MRKGNTYPIPKKDANFSLWSGVTKTPIKNVPISKLKDIGKKTSTLIKLNSISKEKILNT